jgi:hypothetical protein
MNGLTNVYPRTVGIRLAHGDYRCGYDSTSTPGPGLPIASPVTWLSKTHPTWQIGRTGRSGARTVLRITCIPYSSPMAAQGFRRSLMSGGNLTLFLGLLFDLTCF